MAYGLSFQPSQDNAQGGSGSPKAGAQNAVQLLSLRMPTITGGAQSIAPQGLLDAQGGAGVGGAPDKNALLMWLKKLLAQSGADEPPQLGGESGGGAMGASAPPAPPDVNVGGFTDSGTPAPRVIPNGNGDTFGFGRVDPSGETPAPTGGGDLPPLDPSYYGQLDPFDVGGY